MLRSSLSSDANRNLPASSPIYCNNDKSKGSRKRHTTKTTVKLFTSSTLVTFCALASFIFLSIQVRLYFKTALDRKFWAPQDDPRLPKEHFSKDRHEEKHDSFIVNQQTKNAFTQNRAAINNSTDRAKKQETKPKKNQETNTDRSPFAPRVVQMELSAREAVSRIKSMDVQSADSPETAQSNNLPKAKSVKEQDLVIEPRDSHDLQLLNGTYDVDDEETVLEDKNAIQNQPLDTGGYINMQEECVPMAKWQTSVPVNCNSIHELDILSSIGNAGGRNKRRSPSKTNMTFPNAHIHHSPLRHPTWNETQLKFLGQGWFRAAWRVDRQLLHPKGGTNKEGADDESDGGKETLILKMLRPERDFTYEFYELHRIDAVAMEQLTHSKFVLNVYGYCGQSALNEFASFRIPELSSLEKFDRQLRGKNHPNINRIKLKLAVSIATGLAHAHELPADLVGDDRATMAHYDLNPRNVAIVKGGMPKLNDFNVAHFLKWNPQTNKSCGFESRLHEPWWRAPEEVSLNGTAPLTEAVDVYSLGNLLFHILTTHSPRGKMKDYRMESVRQEVLKGNPPSLPKEWATSKDSSVIALRKAMNKCFAKDPQDRPTAREVANLLFDAYLQIAEAENKEKT